MVTKQPIEIYGPAGLRDFIWQTMELSHTELVFPYVVHELVPTADQCPTEELKEFVHVDKADNPPKDGQGRTILLDSEENSYLLVDDEQFVVKAFRLFHRIPSFGFSVVEKKRPGKLNAQKLKDLGKCFFPSSSVELLLTKAVRSVIETFSCLPGLKLTFSLLTSFAQSLFIKGNSWGQNLLYRAKTKYLFEFSLQLPRCTFLICLIFSFYYLGWWSGPVVSGLGFYFFHVIFLKYVFNDIFGQRLFAIVLNLATPTNCSLGFPSLLTLPSQSTLIKLIWCLEYCLNQFYIPGFITLGSKHPEIGLGPIEGFIPPPC
nr:zinc phosphodiesterase ELAC protein 1 isoform X4 [Kogia breviceps]XP_058895796.1 zinc phosphodiesterase ELAC protein 1 isoform X4 [Kogia breviceps]XP_058895797.1 zinc phosphodiesterase ELAC protein 1 isoform X4 [Kogia breviceps]XP_058895798.1 zinc phosphodiesterase ELAC protein 1 isoform X4 [Kogia breviceps]